MRLRGRSEKWKEKGTPYVLRWEFGNVISEDQLLSTFVLANAVVSMHMELSLSWGCCYPGSDRTCWQVRWHCVPSSYLLQYTLLHGIGSWLDFSPPCHTYQMYSQLRHVEGWCEHTKWIRDSVFSTPLASYFARPRISPAFLWWPHAESWTQIEALEATLEVTRKEVAAARQEVTSEEKRKRRTFEGEVSALKVLCCFAN